MYEYPYPPEPPIYQHRPSLRARLGRGLALALALTGATAAGATIIVRKLQPESIALITGLLCSGIPLLAIIVIQALLNAKKDARRQAQQPPHQMMIPPIIMQMPAQQQAPPQPDYINYPWALPRQNTAATRVWEVVGEKGEQ